MSSRKAFVSAAASVVTALVLVGCSDSSVSGTSVDENGTMSAQSGNLDNWANNYSYSQPENSYSQPEDAADRSQPAGAAMPGDSDDDR